MNWKVCKLGCFRRESWLGEFLDLLNMEWAACLLKNIDKNMEDHWANVYYSLMMETMTRNSQCWARYFKNVISYSY